MHGRFFYAVECTSALDQPEAFFIFLYAKAHCAPVMQCLVPLIRHVVHTQHAAPRRYIRRGLPESGFPLFESESLRWPGFVEFDDVNGKVLTYSAIDR